jgi:polyisoprenoid-binding protein YceI
MKFTALALLLGITLAANGTAATHQLSADNTKIKFVGSKKDGKHEGSFSKLSGSFTVDDTVSKLDLSVTIDVDSMSTDNPKLTSHLKSPDFFDVKKFPEAKFVSKSVKKEGDGYVVTGDLTMHGKTKVLSFPAKVAEAGGEKTVTCAFKLNRKHWGIDFNKGGLNDDVEMSIEVKVK